MKYNAIEPSWVYYCTVDEFIEQKIPKSKIENNRPIRLAGTVEKINITGNQQDVQLDFELAGQKHSLAIRYNAIVPQNFQEGKDVVVEGTIGIDGIFNANKILTRCESKYKAKLQTKLSEPDNPE